MNTSKTYSNKSNAIRAAKAALVKQGIEQPVADQHFELTPVDGRYSWNVIEQPTASEIKEKATSIAGMVSGWAKQGFKLNEEPVAEKPKREAMPRRNGHTHPAPGTKCAEIWDIISQLANQGDTLVKPEFRDVKEIALAEGFNPATIKTQWARWRQYHGVK